MYWIKRHPKWALVLTLSLVSLTLGCNPSRHQYVETDYYEGYYRGLLFGFEDCQSNNHEWKIFTNGRRYGILLPSDWSIGYSRTGEVVIESLTDSAYIIVGPVYRFKSINEAVDAQIDNIKSPEYSSNFSLISDKEVRHHGLRTRIVEYNWKYNWEDSLSANKLRYCKSYTMMAGDGLLYEVRFYVWQLHYNTNESIMNRSLGSFHPFWELQFRKD